MRALPCIIAAALLASCAAQPVEPLTAAPIPTEPSPPEPATRVAFVEPTPPPEPPKPPPPGPPGITLSADATAQRTLTSTALLLAGLPDPASSSTLRDRASWKARTKRLAKQFDDHERSRLSAARSWADAQLVDVRGSSNWVFYPFGGPDALYPITLFPNARTIVMVGLEPAGSVPEVEGMKSADQDKLLQRTADQIAPLLRLSFFRTEDIQRGLRKQGVVPLLMAFVARTGHQVLQADSFVLRHDGSLTPAPSGDDATGARIIYRKQGEEPRSIVYFTHNLADGPFQDNPGLTAWVQQWEPPITFLKAASYLMHKDSFDGIRELILQRSSAVVEDDSGIPFEWFDRSQWDARVYGAYSGPIQIFAHYRQDDLADAFEGPAAHPLPFGIGYKFKPGTSNLIVAVRKPRSAH